MSATNGTTTSVDWGWFCGSCIDCGDVRYRLGHRIGEGSCGSVFEVLHLDDDRHDDRDDDRDDDRHDDYRPMCAKLERVRADKGTFLKMEYRVYVALSKTPHPEYFPKAIDFGVHSSVRFLILERGGPSLRSCAHEMSMRQKLGALWHAIRALRTMHDAGLLHRDIKPSNVLRAPGNRVQFVDMGFVKRYLTGVHGTHIPNVRKRTMTGTMNYASVATLSGTENSRRCDVESLVYTWVDIMDIPNHHLPWTQFIREWRETRRDRGGASNDKQSLRRMIRDLAQKKLRATATEVVGEHGPPCLRHMLRMVRRLEFVDRPPYESMMQLVARDLGVQ